MNTYQIQFDATRITVKANDKEQAFHIVQKRNSNFFKKEDKYYYRFDENYEEELYFEQIAEVPGIIQWEQH